VVYRVQADRWKAPWSAALEREYNLREAFPDYADYFAEWSTRSAAARARLNCTTGIPYGAASRQKLDIFRAEQRDAPVMMFVHGGYWRSMDRSDFSFLAEPLVARGIALAIPSYSLCPEATLDEIVAEIQAALSWLAKHVNSFGGNPQDIHLCGWSAGAQLVAMLLASSTGPLVDGSRSGAVASALLLSGVYDLRPVRRTSANDDLRLDETAAERNSPLLLKPTVATRLAIAAGALETEAFRQQSADFATAWGKHLPAVASHLIPEVHHYSIVSALCDEQTALFRVLLEQFICH